MLAADEPLIARFLGDNHALRVARRGELVETLRWPALLAESDGQLAGLLTYIVRGRDCEVLTLHATRPWHGTGTALLVAVERVARGRGCDRLWLITTNDNVDALRFYQRRGFRLAALHRGAVDESRATLKQEIPVIGDHGIAIHDEIELERALD